MHLIIKKKKLKLGGKNSFFQKEKHKDSRFSINFSSPGQIPNPTGLLRGFGQILVIQKEPLVTFSTGPKRPPLIENPED